jgi:glycosyltransferase involved in cell wall biosynthesis
MRVAFVSDAVYPFNKGGKEKRLHEIAVRLARAGHQVDVYTMKWWDGPRTLRVDGVAFHAITPLLPLYSGNRRSTAQALLFGLATLRLLGRRFDVLDVDSIPYFPLFSGRLVAALRRRRMIATWHEVWGPAYWLAYLGRAGRLAAALERWAAAMPHEVVAVSEQTRAAFTARLNADRPVWAVPLGVDFDRIAAAKPSDERVDVLFAGRLLENKRVDVLIRAIAVMHPDVRAVVVGEGPEREHLEALAVAHGVADRVRFAGFLDADDDLYALMKASAVFALPSVREGFGLVVLEANACGTPVVTVEHPDNGARHLVEDGANGYVCGLDVHELAVALTKAIDNRNAMRADAYVRQRHADADWAQVADRICQVLAGTAAKMVEPAS